MPPADTETNDPWTGASLSNSLRAAARLDSEDTERKAGLAALPPTATVVSAYAPEESGDNLQEVLATQAAAA